MTKVSFQLIRYFLYLAVVLLVTICYWVLYKKPLIGIDDSCIYFTYVRNFVDGHGFVYNVGGERVEGFTSILWVLILSLFYWLSPEYYTQITLVFNTLLIASGLFYIASIIRTMTRQTTLISIPEILLLALLTLIPGYFDWTVLTLMETGMWSAFLIVIVTRIASDAVYSTKDIAINTFFIAMLVFIRPESLLLGVFFIGLLFLRRWSLTRSFGSAIRFIIVPMGILVACILLLMAFRIWYFGYPLPNTFYAKVSSDKLYNIYHGLRYLGFSLLQTPALMVVIAGATVSTWKLTETVYLYVRQKSNGEISMASWRQFVFVSTVLVSIFIPIYVGGDHFKMLRFFQPFFPIYYLLFFNIDFWNDAIVVKLKMSPYIRYVLLLLALPIIYLSTATPLHIFRKGLSPIDWEFRLAELGESEAREMNLLFGNLKQLPSVGVSAAGGFAYAYKGEVIDLMGLNNVEMAHASTVKIGIKNHAAFEKRVFYDQAPDIFHGYAKTSKFVASFAQDSLLENSAHFEEAFVSRLYKQLFTEPKFRTMYTPVIIADAKESVFLKTYCKTTFIDILRSSGFHVKELERAPYTSQPDVVSIR